MITPVLFFLRKYSWTNKDFLPWIAPVGHIFTHFAHLMHVLGNSIFGEIESVGQLDLHKPHLVHKSGLNDSL